MCSDLHLKPLRIRTVSKQFSQPENCRKGYFETNSALNLTANYFLLFFDVVGFDERTNECSLMAERPEHSQFG